MKFAFWTFFLSTAVLINARVIELTPKNFDTVVGSKKPVFVKFYAPWCGHCKRLEPIYEELSDMFENGDVIIARVNADTHHDLGKKFDVKGYPTLKWFDPRSKVPKSYSGGRDIESFLKFIHLQGGYKPKKVTSKPTAIELTPENFYNVVMDSSKNVLVMFYAPWCGHCKALKPTYNKLHVYYLLDEDVIIAKLNADAHRDLANEYNIEGYPTIKFFLKGVSKTPIDYQGMNTESELISFINKHAGTMRKSGGGLNEMAGRISSLDEIAKKISSTSDKKSLLLKLKDLANNSKDKYAKYYYKVCDKALVSFDYIEKEHERIRKLLKKNMDRSKLDDLQIRKNILSVFLKKKKISDEL